MFIVIRRLTNRNEKEDKIKKIIAYVLFLYKARMATMVIDRAEIQIKNVFKP